MLLLESYAAYLTIGVGVTLLVAQVLQRNGRIFLLDAFAGDERRADALNRLMRVGFHLINLGFVGLFIRLGPEPQNAGHALSIVGTKLGWALLWIGVMHYLNVRAYTRARRRAIEGPAPIVTRPPLNPPAGA